ncbi:hypothetical protein KCU79_g10157, partial [Aureobasidium melanogenum]
MVKTLPFGSSGLKVNSPGFGAMSVSFGLGTNLTFKQAEPVLLKAIEPGCTFWDTAVVYAAGINDSLGHGWLVDEFAFKTPEDFAADDFRRTSPKFQGDNIYKNRAIIALAWGAAQGFIAIPRTTKPHRLEENWASRDVELTGVEKAEMRRIIDSAKPHGNGYSEVNQKLAGH